MRFSNFKSWLAGLCVLALVGCGGGGGGGEPILGGGTGGGTQTGVSDLQVKLSTPTVDNTGAQNVTATVTAVNASGQGVAGVPIELKVDKNATYSITSTQGSVTGADGTVKADVTIGNDSSLRTITVTASTGSLPSRAASFDVVGSRQLASDLLLTAPVEIQNSLGNSITVTATAVDANRNALPNIPVTFSVDSGAVLAPSGTVTNSQGVVTGVLRIGADQSSRVIRVVATSGPVTREIQVQVRGARLTASGIASAVPVNSRDNRVTFLLVDNTGAKMANYPITVRMTGLANPMQGVTDSFGEFLYTYTAPGTAQDIVIEASAGGAVSRETVAVTGSAVIPPADTVVNSASLAVSPNVVAINPSGVPATNKVEVRALFVGANNKPVKNVRVWFDLDGDKQSIGGTLDSTAGGVPVLSDANGVARTTYAPGIRFSPKDGVTIRACWSRSDFSPPGKDAPCWATVLPEQGEVRTTLTVNSDSLSVSIGTNAVIQLGASQLTYVKRYVVQVVDSSGQAKAGVQVAPSIDLLTYYKGQWVIDGDKWAQQVSATNYPTVYPSIGNADPVNVPPGALRPNREVASFSGCDNEDLNRNGVAENFEDQFETERDSTTPPDKWKKRVIAEDQNGSGALSPQRPSLDPRKADVTISAEGSSVTDANGIVVLKIEYPQNVASWVRFNILVAASGVAGTEGRANFDGVLPVLATAVTTISADPPFRYSPYGLASSPAFKRQNLEGQAGWLCTNPN